jgi:hypothetical protein
VRTTIAAAAVILAVVSVIAYGVGALGSPRPTAPVFVLVPPIASGVAMIAVLVAAVGTRR